MSRVGTNGAFESADSGEQIDRQRRRRKGVIIGGLVVVRCFFRNPLALRGQGVGPGQRPLGGVGVGSCPRSAGCRSISRRRLSARATPRITRSCGSASRARHRRS